MNYQNSYISGEKAYIKRLLASEDIFTVIDVGANKGDFIEQIVKNAQECKIFGFEPHPITYKSLFNRFNANDNISLYNVAVGEKPGTLNLYDYEYSDGSAHASLYKEVLLNLRNTDVVHHHVEVIKLIDLIREQNINKVDLLKIDTEGNELNVLKGLELALKQNRIKRILFEFNDANIVSRTTFLDFWNLLSNYTLFRVLPGGKLLRLKTYKTIICELYAYQNIVAILKD